MWKATKIELITNVFNEESDMTDTGENNYTLKINDVVVNNFIYNLNEYNGAWMFQSNVCDYCGIQGCNSRGMLDFKKYSDSLLITPIFDSIDWSKLDTSKMNDDEIKRVRNDFPPGEWLEKGILWIEGDELLKLYELIPGLKKSDIPLIKLSELERILEWEILVTTQPNGFKDDWFA